MISYYTRYLKYGKNYVRLIKNEFIVVKEIQSILKNVRIQLPIRHRVWQHQGLL